MLSPRYLYNQYINSMTLNDILFNVISRPMEGMSVDIKPDLEITFDLNCTMNCRGFMNTCGMYLLRNMFVFAPHFAHSIFARRSFALTLIRPSHKHVVLKPTMN